MSRRTKLTPDVQHTLAFALSEGATIEHACDYAGIHPATFHRWMQRGEEDEPKFRDFCEAITRARGQGVVTDLLTIFHAVRAGDWRAAAWRLQHRYPQEYGAKLKLQGDADHPLHVLHTMPQEQLEAKITQLLHQCGYDGGPTPLPAPTVDMTPEDLR
jgi:hypothetical protein